MTDLISGMRVTRDEETPQPLQHALRMMGVAGIGGQPWTSNSVPFEVLRLLRSSVAESEETELPGVIESRRDGSPGDRLRIAVWLSAPIGPFLRTLVGVASTAESRFGFMAAQLNPGLWDVGRPTAMWSFSFEEACTVFVMCINWEPAVFRPFGFRQNLVLRASPVPVVPVWLAPRLRPPSLAGNLRERRLEDEFQSWVQQLVLADKVDGTRGNAMLELYDRVDKLLSAGRFQETRRVMEAFPPALVSTPFAVGVLTVTFAATRSSKPWILPDGMTPESAAAALEGLRTARTEYFRALEGNLASDPQREKTLRGLLDDR